MLCLIVAAGVEGLSIDRALAEVAGGDGSARAHSRVRMDVSRLRKRIGPDILPSATGVWRLQVSSTEVDYFNLQTLMNRPLPTSAEIATLLRGRAFHDGSPGVLVNEAIHDVRAMRFELMRRMLQEPDSITVATLQSSRRLIDDDPLNEDLISLVTEHHLAIGHQQGAKEILAATAINFHELLEVDLPESLVRLEQRVGTARPNLPGSGVPQSSGEAQLPKNQLVGRENESQLIAEWLDGPTTQPLLLTGASGSGKSALLREVVQSGLTRQYRVVQIVGREFESRPYLPFIRVLGQDFEKLTSSGDTAETEVWVSALDELSAETSLRTLLIVDDAQWLDSRSFGLLQFLINASNPDLALMLAGRDTPLGQWETLSSVATSRDAITIDLKELTLGELETLVVRDVPGISVNGRRKLAQEVLEASDGLPAIAVRLIESAEGTTHRLPESSRGYGLSWFVTALPEDVREVALKAAVLGSRMTYPELSSLTRIDDDELLRSLDLLAARGALCSESTPGRMSFPHALVRQSFLDTAEPEEVRRLQRAAAEIVSSPHRRAHLLEASAQELDPQLVAKAARNSADLHLDSGAVVEAVRAYETADRLDPAGSDAPMLARWAGAAERTGLDGSELRQRAFDQAMNSGSLETALQAAISGLPEAERPSGDRQRIALLEEIDGTLLEGRSRLVHITALSRQYALAGQPEQALELNHTASELANSKTDRDEVIRAKWLASYSSTSPAQRLNDPNFYEIDDLPDAARMLIAIDYLGLGDTKQAEKIRSEVTDVLDPASHPTSYWHGLMFKSTLAAARSDEDEAYRYADDAFDFGSVYGVREAGGAWLAQKFILQWMFEAHGAVNFIDDLQNIGNIEVEDNFFAQTAMALGMYQSGMTSEARDLAEELVSVALPHRSYIGVGTIAMCARILGPSASRCTEMIGRLRPLGDSLIVLGSGFLCLGPADLAIAHLSEGVQRDTHLRRARSFTTQQGLSGWNQLVDREQDALARGVTREQ